MKSPKSPEAVKGRARGRTIKVRLRRPRHRPPTDEADLLRADIAESYWRLRWIERRDADAVAHVSKAFGVSASYIRKVLKEMAARREY
jgi:hypothetical protein